MWLKAHLCTCKEAERKNRQQKNLNNLVRASGASSQLLPGLSQESYQPVTRVRPMRLSTAVDLPKIPLQIPGWSYFTQGYEAHYVRRENLASPFLFSWVSGYLFCVCVWWLKCQQLGTVTGVHVPALSATGVTEACAYCVVTTKVDKSVTRLRDWELGADVVISLGCILVLTIGYWKDQEVWRNSYWCKHI